ncbi:MAG TPA: preprotein translocase subunit SecY [Candidatus Omnitrophica bacterium]|nr:preprotein translocase subunit SecY [Candidatus Omnitrophota bacterium]
MINAIVNVFKIRDLRRKLLMTLALIAVYRIGAYIPTPGINGQALSEFFKSLAETPGGNLFGIINMFTGGAMRRLTIFALGVMPYISAAIILQVLTPVIPALEKLAHEERGREKINQWTRYLTVVITAFQAFFIGLWLENSEYFRGYQIVFNPGWGFRFSTVITLTTGTIFIMWLGEQITEYGIGNGISILITAGIISRIPAALYQLYLLTAPFSPAGGQIKPFTLIIMAVMLVAVVIAVVLLTQGQRRIPVQYARRVIGRRVYGGQSTYIPLRINQAGVIPIIFAQSVLLFPATIAGFFPSETLQRIVSLFTRGNLLYYILYSGLIIFFSYFYTAIIFNPTDVAENMKRFGGFIPGVRPGKSTADYLHYIMERITLPGSIFLAVIAILPSIISYALHIPYLVASFFGGTGLLIIVGVLLDTERQLESQLLMRQYEGFMRKGRIRGRR